MIQEKLQPQDGFWDERLRERLVVEQLDAKINNLKGAVNLASKILALKGNAGWQEFVKAVEDCRAWRRQELELSSGADSELRILQGRCRELGAIVSLMTQTEVNTKALSTQLSSLEAERALYVTADGRVKPKGVHS